MESIRIRRGTPEDLPRLEEIYAAARGYMRSQGNMTQWSDHYPSAASALADMEHGWNFVVENEGHIVATFCLMTDPEPTYAELQEAMTVPYVTLHRVASDGSVRGILAKAVEFALSLYSCDIRIDTHSDNSAMLRAIIREGFVPSGTITLADGSPRVAFRLAPYTIKNGNARV